MSRTSRWILSCCIALLAWMLLAGWSDVTVAAKIASAAVAAFMLTLAVGLLAPTRFRLAFRILAGVVALTFAAYFITELWALLGGRTQSFRPGQPSALMAGLGLVVIGIPALVFALSGNLVGIARLFRSRSAADADRDAAT